jgi:hypothetical protein
MFVHIPKTGGTTVEVGILFRDKKGAFPNKSMLGGHRTIHELRELFPVESRSYFTFSIVRNPYARFVSAFFHAYRIFEAGKMPPSFAQKFIKPLGGSHFNAFVDMFGEDMMAEQYAAILLRRQVEHICDEKTRSSWIASRGQKTSIAT